MTNKGRVTTLLTLALMTIAMALSRAVQAQSSPTDTVIKGLEERDKTLTAASALVVEHVFAAENERRAQEIKSMSSRAGKRQFFGNGAYQFATAFDGDKDVVGGGRMVGTTYNKDNTKSSLLTNSRTIYADDQTYMVLVSNGLHIANVAPFHQSDLALRDLGWRIPFTHEFVLKGLQSGAYRYVKSETDSQWGETLEFAGEYHPHGLQFSIRFWIAPQRGYLVTRGEMSSSSSVNVFRMKQMAQVAGFWMPQSCSIEVYDAANGEKNPNFTDNYELSDIVVGSLPASTWASIMRFDRWVDGPTGKYYKVSPTGEKILMPRYIHRSSMGFGWLYMASVTTLLVLTVGAYIRSKREQLAKQA